MHTFIQNWHANSSVAGVRDLQHNFYYWPDQTWGCPILRGQPVLAELTVQKETLFIYSIIPGSNEI